MPYKSVTAGKISPSIYRSLTYGAEDLIKAYSKETHHRRTVEPAILMAEYVHGGTKIQGAELKQWLLTQGFSKYAATKAVRTISHKASRGKIRNTMKHKIKIKAIETPLIPPPTIIYRTQRTDTYPAQEKKSRDVDLRVWYQSYTERPYETMKKELEENWNIAFDESEQMIHNPEVLYCLEEDLGDEINERISQHDVEGAMDEWHSTLSFDKDFKVYQVDLTGRKIQ